MYEIFADEARRVSWGAGHDIAFDRFGRDGTRRVLRFAGSAQSASGRVVSRGVHRAAQRFRDQIRPPIENLPLPHGFTKEQIALGDRVFHGEAAGGRCSICHGRDAKGTATGNDLTTGMYIWADGSVNGIRAVLNHNMSVAPGMDGDLKPTDVEAVAAYIWALGRQNR